MKILWLAPNFNHYKARFLNHLAERDEIDLTIWSGTGREKMGDKYLEQDWNFKLVKLNVLKKDFGNSKLVKEELKTSFKDFNWVLIPAEKKNILLFLYAMLLRIQNRSVRLFSYNHPIIKSKNGKISFLDKLITIFFYKNLDRVIFYTEHSHDWAINNKVITSKKAYWANNSIDNNEIKKHYSFHLPPKNESRIVFIGRLINSKKIVTLLDYYRKLKIYIPNLELDIIGDGPDQSLLQAILKEDTDVRWHGTLVDEAKIAPVLSKASFVFVPGHSGLSINHAFAYGRPYITLQGLSHAPEIAYINHGVNGFVLDEDFDSNIVTIKNLLLNRTILEKFCYNAKSKGEYLSVEKWVNQITFSLMHEK